jgi:hypothetical protein
MDINDFERQLETLSQDLTLRLTEAEAKAEEKIGKIFKMLEGSKEIKNSVLDTLEAEFEKQLSAYQADLKKIEVDIQTLGKQKIRNLTDLKAKEAELTGELEEKLKPFLAAQKKKKAELTQKISLFKRELSNYHKENNFRLIEEEKNFMSQESELERRLNIDLEREYEANVKDYSEYEKSLLETNDEKQIEELKNKIKEVRIKGIKEFRKIKDRYAFSFFEINLEFRKFSEKIILENSLKGEEIKILVHTLEVERDKLEQEEEYEKQVLELEKLQTLLQFERENAVHENQELLEKQLQIVLLKNKSLKINFESKEKEKLSGKEIRKEACDFDLSQLEIYRPISGTFYDKLAETSVKLTNSLIEAVNLYKGTLLEMIAEFLENAKLAHDRFKTVLMLSSRGELPKGGPDLKDLLIQITKMTEIQYRSRKKMFDEINILISGEINEILIRIKNILTALSNFRAEMKQQDETYFMQLREQIKIGYKAIETGIPSTDSYQEGEIRSLKKQRSSIQKEAKIKTQKIIKEYNRKSKRLNDKISSFLTEQKAIKSKRELDDREFLKNSKKRMQQLKKNFPETISVYEKELYQEYQEILENNLLEEKERITEL